MSLFIRIQDNRVKNNDSNNYCIFHGRAGEIVDRASKRTEAQ